MQEKLTKAEIISELSWYNSMGVDELLEDSPTNKMGTASVSIEAQPISNIQESNIIPDSKPVKVYKKPIYVPISAEMPNLDLVKTMEELKEVVLKFNGCPLKLLATNTVFGEGNYKNPDILIIGEAPGADEDKQGIPFVGKSGQLLRKIMQSAKIDNYFITNSVFWRPPGNRTPTPEEISICKPFIEKIIYLTNPKIILTLGRTASELLFSKSAFSMEKIRGIWYNYEVGGNVIRAISTYHPSFLLRTPIQKRNVWNDFIKISKELNYF